jgi:hypothetical protein
MEAIDKSIRRLQDLAKVQDAKLAAGAAHVPGGAANLSMSIAVGTKVLDTVTGQAGEVIHGKRESVILPTATDSVG